MFVCECDSEGCESGVLLSIADYDAIRADAAWFALAAGHERPTDTVVRRDQHHVVVSKQISDLLSSAVRESHRPEQTLSDGPRGVRSRGGF